MDPILITGIVFVSVFMMFLFVGLAFTGRGKTEDDRLFEAARFGMGSSGTADSLRSARSILARSEGNSVLEKIGDLVTSEEEISESPMKTRLAHAGYNTESAVRALVGAKFVMAMAVPLLYVVVQLLLHQPLNNLGVNLTVYGAIGFFLPEVFLFFRIRSRREQMFCGLPNALDLIVICVESGLGLDAAFQKVADEIHLSNHVLSQELNLTCMEIRAGRTRMEALNSFAYRTGLPDVKALVTVLVQAERFGVSTAKALRTHSDDMRLRRRQRAEEAAAKTAVKLVFPLVLFIFPAIFVVLAGPAAIKIGEMLFKN